jgi:hypothetical protein
MIGKGRFAKIPDAKASGEAVSIDLCREHPGQYSLGVLFCYASGCQSF